MWTLKADICWLACQALLNILETFPKPKPIESFKPKTNSFPPLKLFVHLSIHVTFSFFLLFSGCLTHCLLWKIPADLWQIVNIYIFPNMEYVCMYRLLNFFLSFLNSLVNIKDNILYRARTQMRAVWASCVLSPHLQGFLFLYCRREGILSEGWRVGAGQLLFLRFCPSCVMAALGFHVLSGWVSCSSSLCFRAENLRPSEAGDALSPASISAQLSVAQHCSHLADTSFSADTPPQNGLSWLMGSCPYG